MKTVKYRFVENIPDQIESETLYISIKYCTVIHKCLCGCENEVVTPISPFDWKLLFDGKTVSLTPSIGNWNFKCKSHYWIKNNQIVWAKSWDAPLRKQKKKKMSLKIKEYFSFKKR